MIQREAWHQELQAAIQRWNDDSFLPAEVDDIEKSMRVLLMSAAPLVNAIEKAPRSEEFDIPYRARIFARNLRVELEEQAEHIDRFLDKKSLWGKKLYEKFRKEIAHTQQTVVQFYEDMVPYLDALNARLPAEKEERLLGKLQTLALPESSEPEVMDAEFTVEE